MRDGYKIIIGVGVTALLAWALHGPFGRGQAFLADLRVRTVHALAGQGVRDVWVSYSDSPYDRTARLSGAVAPAEREKAIAIVSGVEGGAGSVWSGATPGSPPATPARAGPVVQQEPASVHTRSTASCRDAVTVALGERAVQFRAGSAWLSPQSQQTIADVAAALRSCGGYAVLVRGHSSSRAAAHRAMARERAARVRDALIAVGIPAEAVSTAVSAADPSGLRVSFVVTDGGA